MVAHTTVTGAQNTQEKTELSLFSLEKKQLWKESNCCLQPSKGCLERRQSQTPLRGAQKKYKTTNIRKILIRYKIFFFSVRVV